ncbi:hypothetical protein M9458_003784, partial [Cirrhinus mrigala]
STVPPGKCREGATSGRELSGLTVTVRNSPKTRAPSFTSTSQPVELPKEQAGPPRGVPLVSFGALPDDRMSIMAVEGEPDLSGEDDPSTLPSTRQSAVPDTDPEMMGLNGSLHRIPNPLGWMIGISGAPPRYLSSRRCMMSSLECGRTFYCPKLLQWHIPTASCRSFGQGVEWQAPFEPLQDSVPACIGLHQEGRGPARIFGRRIVPRVRAGGFPGNPEARASYVPK